MVLGDTADSGNGVVEKIGAANEHLKGSDAISPLMSYDSDTTHQHMLAKAETRH
jgi:hypothetical protein